MGFKFSFFLLILFCGFIKTEAQTVGVYGSTFISGWKNGISGKEYSFGPSAGLTFNGILKGQLNLGIDIKYANVHAQGTRTFYMKGSSFENQADTFYKSNYSTYNAVTSFMGNFEITSHQEDTFVICFAIQAGAVYLQDYTTFSNANLPDLNFSSWTYGGGFSGTLRRNYVFKTPLQLFFTLGVESYKINHVFEKIKRSAFQENKLNPGYAKLGLAYKFN